ncbi:unnamed protein product [Clonostachys byssicola]|uniref:F-box domain-containing protein n=1 Tax=Clonostachys byssicola TaxID=160290 RepID=A0A9N9XZW4_9HYPO|nr:unnamed protein product [Clonostachys byssicola]
MAAQDLPNELLGRIIGLMEPASTALTARSVCQRWNTLAVPHAFRKIILRPTEEGSTEEGFKAWGALLENERIKDAVREILIYSHITDDDEGYWDELPAGFITALQKIADLHYIEKITVNFSPVCCGPESIGQGITSHETYEKRISVFEAVFNAIQTRSNQPGRTSIRSFAVENMQNAPIPTFTSSSLFKSVTEDLEELDLHIVQEHSESRPESDLHEVELVTFEPWLQDSLLMPMANLTSLSLCIDEFWGTAPGTFNGRGLAFPRLKSLKLKYFNISHYNHFDWVLNQTTLESLRLDSCTIATILDLWNPEMHDWEPIAEDTFGSDFGELFLFPGTWEFIFDKIRTSLPNLADFEFFPGPRYIREDRNSVREDINPTQQTTVLYGSRYSAFCESEGWVDPTEFGGVIDFCDLEPNEQAMLDRHKPAEEGDQRALDELLDATKRRQKQ